MDYRECGEYGRWLFDFAEEPARLSPYMRVRVEDHLAACPKCHEAVHQWQDLFYTLTSTARLAPSAQLIDRVITETLPPAAPRRLLPNNWLTEERVHVIASLAAALIVMLVGQTLPTLPLDAAAVFGSYGEFIDMAFSTVMHWSDAAAGIFH